MANFVKGRHSVILTAIFCSKQSTLINICTGSPVFVALVVFHTIMLDTSLYPACFASSRMILLASSTLCLVSKAVTGLSALRKTHGIFPDVFPQLTF